MNRNHTPPDVPMSAANVRSALQLGICCANHAAEVALVAAISFAADVAGDDRAEMERFIRELTKHVLKMYDTGNLKFRRPLQS